MVTKLKWFLHHVSLLPVSQMHSEQQRCLDDTELRHHKHTGPRDRQFQCHILENVMFPPSGSQNTTIFLSWLEKEFDRPYVQRFPRDRSLNECMTEGDVVKILITDRRKSFFT